MKMIRLLAAALAAFWVAVLQAEPPSTAPLNPDFTSHLEKQEQAVTDPRRLAPPDDDENYGYVPPPTVLPQVQEDLVFGMERKTFATRYDLRTLGKVTPVRDQGNEGACWAFATFGSMESCLLTAENRDFSENNLVNLAGFDWGFSDGGNAEMSTAYLARWNGPVLESQDPYPRPGQSTSLAPLKHVQRVYFFPKRTSYTANSLIKQALIDYGAVYTTMSSQSGYLKESTAGYYYNGAQPCNHAVTIVGWDDDFSKANFLIQPPGNGAFIVKNSWGTGWGKAGYFYISYYDTKVAENSAVFTRPEAVDNYARQYQYDPLGAVRWFGYGNAVCWGANIFTATAGESLRAVSFNTPIAGSQVAIYIYTGCAANSPRSGTLRTTQTGTLTHAGYHTLKLNTAVALTAGQRFSVVVKFTTTGYNYPLPFECALSGYSSRATASPGQSFFSSTGTSWTDMTSYDRSANVCIKAFTGTGTPPPPTPPPPPPPPTPGAPLLTDYDGDGLADPALYRSTGNWRAILSRNGYRPVSFNTVYSGSQFLPMPGDFDGDGMGDPAVLDRSSGRYRFYSSRHGYARYYIPQAWYKSGARNSAGDMDGDRYADPVAYDPVGRTWYILMSAYNYTRYAWVQWGGSSWIPFCADYDRDGYGDLIAYDTSSKYWYILLSSQGYRRYTYHYFGYTGFTPVVDDADGDGRADLGLYNVSTGVWRILLSSTGYQRYATATWSGN